MSAQIPKEQAPAEQTSTEQDKLAEAADVPAIRPRRARRSYRRRARRWMIAASALGVALLITTGLTVHLWRVADEWERQTQELIQISYDLGAQLTAEQETRAAREDQITLISEQLATVQQRLLDLAALVARSDDDAVVTEQHISVLEELLDNAGAVGNALARCVESQNQLADYLRDAEFYDPEELEAYEDSVDRLCAAAASANEQLQEALTRI